MSTSSGSDLPAATTDDSLNQALIEFESIALRFRIYKDKSPRLKQLLLNRLTGKNYVQRTEFWLFRDLHLRIQHGDRLGIVGSNGAGKSTLLKLISGIYHPTAGSIRIRGRIVPLIELGGGFNMELSAIENVFLNGAVLGFSQQEMEEKLERILNFASLLDFLDMPVKYYSSGMLLRLSFSIATDVNPEILLLDEIFAAGDAEFRKKAQNRMQELLTNAHIVVMVSHDLSLISEICNRAIWLDHGRIVMEGGPAEVCDAYLHKRYPPESQLPMGTTPQ